VHRWLHGYKPIEWPDNYDVDVDVDEDDIDPGLRSYLETREELALKGLGPARASAEAADKIDWWTWKWRRNAYCINSKCPAKKYKKDYCTSINSECSKKTMWPSHETWGAIELALPRFLLNMAIIWTGQLVNTRSDVIRNEGWGDKNVTAQWYVDQGNYHSQGDEYIATMIERRKIYDFMHGSWQFLSALFLMKQTLGIMLASNGKIEDLNVYAGKAEKVGVSQSWAIVIAVYLEWQMEAGSTAWMVLWCVAAVPGSIFSARLLTNRKLKKRRNTNLKPSWHHHQQNPAHFTGVNQGEELQPLASPLLAPGDTGPGSTASSCLPDSFVSVQRSYQPPVAHMRSSGGVTRLVSRPKSEQLKVWSISEVSDDIRNTRLSLPQLPQTAAGPRSTASSHRPPASVLRDSGGGTRRKSEQPAVWSISEVIDSISRDSGGGTRRKSEQPAVLSISEETDGISRDSGGTRRKSEQPTTGYETDDAKRISSTATVWSISEETDSITRDSGGGTRRKSEQPAVRSFSEENDGIFRDSGGTRRKSEQPTSTSTVWSISEETDSIRTRLSSRSRSQHSSRSSLLESDDTSVLAGI